MTALKRTGRHARLWVLLPVLAIGLMGMTSRPSAPPQDDSALKAAIAGDQRSESHKAQDRYRHPLEYLKFARLNASATVVEILPGSGYWTEILAPYLRAKGRYIAVLPDEAADPQMASAAQTFKDRLALNAKLYGKAKYRSLADADFAPPASADLVLMSLTMHEIMAGQGGGYTVENVLARAFNALKKGGLLVIEDHRGDPKLRQDPDAARGYVREDYAIALAAAAGFQLFSKSHLLNNPKDKKNHPHGAFSLPPDLRGVSAKDKAKYMAIGASDRFLLRFVKP